jgi:DNA polymerase
MSGEAPWREAALERLRFELALGLEAVRREGAPGVLARGLRTAGETPAAPARAPAPGPAAAAQEDMFAVDKEVQALSPAQKAERWQALEARARACTRCPLHKQRTNVVFGEGSRQARLCFVGEGPGEDEDRTGRPFVGRAGQLLDKMIVAMGLKREEVFICNVVKCRPPANRTPLPEEASACWPHLEEQLALLQPKVIVALGAPATKTLLKISLGITQLRGHWYTYRGIRVMPTYHPAYVLRMYTPTVRGQVWSDLQQVLAYLKAPTA